MSFVEPAFAYFLPIFICLWLLARGRYSLQLGVMLAGSLVFYAHNRWWMLGLIVSYCIVDWATALQLNRSNRPALWLTLGVGFNIVVLGFWKYTPLFAHAALDWFGVSIVAPSLLEGWSTPIGVSFYAFSGIAYMVDVYRGIVQPEQSLLRYGLFTSFFPHLVAGPILRAREFLVDLSPGFLPERPLAPWEGTFLVARGLFKKLVLADTIATGIDPFFANIGDSSTAGVWALPYLYLYSLQIYFDFSGYTDMARGLGLWFGFRWPENFNWPYLAQSVQEFWRRWHMTLSRFLRDYVYIPLGGGQHSPIRTAASLMLTMLLGGLWHGANWSFLFWGGLHGLLLVSHRVWSLLPLRNRLAGLTGPARLAWTAACVALTFNSVSVAWCFFRVTEFRASCACVQKSFSFDRPIVEGAADAGLWVLLAMYGLATVAALVATRGIPLGELQRALKTRPLLDGLCWGLAIGIAGLAVLIAPGGERPAFIYFQF